MCQAYEGERAGIVALEDRATIKGFAAARAGFSKSANPYYWSGLFTEAWDHGWGCWQEKLLPWALEQRYRTITDIPTSIHARQKFKETQDLPPELERIVEIYSS
ncbi:hypothetical protein HY495_01680 [Candidatus Woesearchaeota archaeon]|nr:hypothetical protein [Candidatus Woesearchaeota archaeon]